jgi:hypothetical protein
MAVVEFDLLDLFLYFGMILQHHYITRHECLVQPVGDLNGLPGRVLVRFRYQHQHIFLVEVEVPYVREYCAELANAIQFQELDLAVYDGLLCEWTWR